MKKINILSIVIVLLALASPLMADVVVSGVVKYGVILGPNAAAGDELTSEEKTDAEIKVTAAVDDNNTATITIEDDGGGAIVLNEAKYVTNLLGAFGLGDIPVTVTLTGGYWESGIEGVGVFSKYEIEDVFDMATETWQFGIDVGIMDMVTVRVDLDPSWEYQVDPLGTPGNAADANIGYLMGAFGGAGPVMAEFFYTNRSAPYDELGLLGIGVGVSLEFGDIGINVGVNAQMNLVDDPLVNTADLGIGIGFTFAELISASLSTWGYIGDAADSSIIDRMSAHVSVTPIDMITLSLGMVLGIGDVYVDALQQLDINLSTNAGALTLNTGFQLTAETVGTAGIKDTFSWKTNTNEGGFYIGGELKY